MPGISPPPVRQMIREAAEALAAPFSNAEAVHWVQSRYPRTNLGTTQAQLAICTVNQPARVHYPENQRARVANDPRYDFLFRVSKGKRERYEPDQHGTWRIARDVGGTLIVCCDGDTPPVVEPPTGLGVVLVRSQIEAANRLKERCHGWSGSEQGFDRLHTGMPGFELPVALIKAAAVNDLYFTNVYAIWRMGQHLADVAGRLPDDPVQAVAEIASLRHGEGKSGPTHWSFASKIAHFFVDPDRFPIYDSYCAAMVAWHLGKGECDKDPSNPYRAFKTNIDRLRERCGFELTYRELDRYLWLAGQYRERRSKGESAQINTELRTLFEDPSRDVQTDLAALLPPGPQLWPDHISATESGHASMTRMS